MLIYKIFVHILLNTISIFCFWVGVSRYKTKLLCREEIQGTFLCCDTLGFGKHIYTAAKFEYTYKGKTMKKYALEELTSKKKQEFQTGHTYKLYINPKNPQIIKCTKKTFYISDFFHIFIGGFIMFIYFFALFFQLIKMIHYILS